LQAAQTQSADKPSPEADPTADLWRLYANGKPIDNIAELTKSAFEASPRPLLETPVRSGGFRRWVSTGNDWPNSRNKRVCMNTRTNIKLWQDHTAAETGGKSKVAAMVEKIQESLSSQSLLAAQHQSVNEKSEAPSSSSPLPGVKMARTQERSGFSPVRKAVMKDRFNRRAMDIHTESADDADRNRTTRQPPAILELTLGHSVESKNIVASDIPGSAPLHFRKQGPLPAYKRPSIVRAPIATKPDAVVKAGPVLAQAMDEFAEDFDLTADDIDEIMGELPAVSGGSKQGSIEDREAVSHSIDLTETDHNSGYRPNPRIPHLKSNDDEFGGSDIDEDDFALADVCATQALRVSRD
jgi:DNA replication ATP-dependent helicase Dna2